MSQSKPQPHYQEHQRRRALKKHQNHAMQHYLAYLKSDAGPIEKEKEDTKVSFSPSIKEIWTGPVVYPPFED